ncbi:MAG: phosphoribosylglycinamide formyltransferase [Steroidobacteraceae bacterium]
MNGRALLRLAILISGRGTNMAAIARACASGGIHARVVTVIADRAGAVGLDAAQQLQLPVQLIAGREFPDRSAHEAALSAAIDASGADLVVLAGFMRILTAEFTARYAGRLLNIHPALLPAYKGLHTHERVLAAGDAEHGATVHYVTAELDGGPLVAQTRISVAPDDTAATLSARVQATEYILYPKVIGWIAAGELEFKEGAPWLQGKPVTTPLRVAVPEHEGAA